MSQKPPNVMNHKCYLILLKWIGKESSTASQDFS